MKGKKTKNFLLGKGWKVWEKQNNICPNLNFLLILIFGGSGRKTNFPLPRYFLNTRIVPFLPYFPTKSHHSRL
uniref:Uncharacterized protein n=1 Tax=Rhizophora mucronata TaxID=61149 RepID=A0A2P2JBI3_RHIMU